MNNEKTKNNHRILSTAVPADMHAAFIAHCTAKSKDGALLTPCRMLRLLVQEFLRSESESNKVENS
jgi:hypothetical protein